jgi:sec-independent protein translocase protein TatB
MFDIGWSELVVIGVVALIAIGPKELPAVLRTVGQYMGKIRKMAAEFQGQFQEAMREAEMADLKKQVDDIADSAKGLTDFDPVAEMKTQVEAATADPLGLNSAAATASASPEAAASDIPAPVPADVTIPQPADAAITGEAPQPQAAPREPSDIAAKREG